MECWHFGQRKVLPICDGETESLALHAGQILVMRVFIYGLLNQRELSGKPFTIQVTTSKVLAGTQF